MKGLEEAGDEEQLDVMLLNCSTAKRGALIIVILRLPEIGWVDVHLLREIRS